MTLFNNSNNPDSSSVIAMYLKNIYFIFVFAPLLYTFVVYNIAKTKAESLNLDITLLTEKPFIYYFIAGIIAIILIINYLGKLIKNINNPTQSFQFEIIRYVLIQSLSVLGLVVYFSQNNFTQFLALVTVAFISMLFVYPKQKAL